MRPQAFAVAVAFALAGSVQAAPIARTGILYDRVLPLSRIEELDGSARARPTTRSQWNQVLFELTRASIAKPTWPDHRAVAESARRASDAGVVPIAILDFDYERSRAGVTEPTVQRAFAATALRAHTHRGDEVTFAFEPAWFATNRAVKPRAFEVDFDDGRGWRAVGRGDQAARSLRAHRA